jgi:hypothetical protein
VEPLKSWLVAFRPSYRRTREPVRDLQADARTLKGYEHEGTGRNQQRRG